MMIRVQTRDMTRIIITTKAGMVFHEEGIKVKVEGVEIITWKGITGEEINHIERAKKNDPKKVNLPMGTQVR